MAHVAEGRSTKEVAARLGISPRTVDKHIEQALRTLGASNRMSAVNLIRRRSGPGSRTDRWSAVRSP